MPDPNSNQPINQSTNQTVTPPVEPVAPTVPVVSPTFSPQDDIPSIPAFQAVVNEVPITPQVEPNGSAAPIDTPTDNSFIPTISSPKKKFGGGKVIATILGLFVLIGGVGAGIYLTQQQQILQPKADVGLDCVGKSDGKYKCKATEHCDNGVCKKNDTTNTKGCICKKANGTDNGSGTCNKDGTCTCPDNLVKNNQCPNAPQPTTSGSAGCVFDHYSQKQQCVQINGAWKRCDITPVGEYGINIGCSPGTHNNCPPSGNPSYTNCGTGGFCFDPTSHCTPPGVAAQANCTAGTGCGGNNDTASCTNIKAYNSSWAALSSAQLAALKAGTTVNFCVIGTASAGSFDKAKFTINGATQAETTTKRPGNQDFCQSYAIPVGVMTFNVTAQIHHTTLGWK